MIRLVPRIVAASAAVALAATMRLSSAQESPPASEPVPDADGMIAIEDGHTGEIVRIPASELGPPPAPIVLDDASERAALGLPPRDSPPRRWANGPTRCSRYGRFRYCDGPLRVPEPFGPEEAIARRLGLGTHVAGGIALSREPRDPWLAEVRGQPFHEQLLWPVDGGSYVRGLKPDRRVRIVVRRNGRRITRWVTKPGHNGVDIAAPPGTHVLAVEQGLVLYARNEMRGYGNVVIVLHSNGSISLYSHMRAAWVFPGQTVLRGQILGEVGETGLARGPHLHFEWRRNGAPLNPVPRFTRRPARPGEPEPPPLVIPPEEETAPEQPASDEPIEIEDESELEPEPL